jgi:hypothetical protein
VPVVTKVNECLIIEWTRRYRVPVLTKVNESLICRLDPTLPRAGTDQDQRVIDLGSGPDATACRVLTKGH